MKRAAKSKANLPPKMRSKPGGKSKYNLAKMSVDREPERTALRPSTAEKMRLKNQLTEECFSVSMESEIPTYRWYVNTLPKEEQEDMDFSQMLPTQNYECMREEMEIKEEPLEYDFIEDAEILEDDGRRLTEDPLFGEQAVKMDAEFTIELLQENEALKMAMDTMRKEHNDKMVNLITRASDVQAKDRSRIDELTTQLAQFERRLQTQLRQQAQMIQLHLQQNAIPSPFPEQQQPRSPEIDVVVIDDDESTSAMIERSNQREEQRRREHLVELQQKVEKLQVDCAFQKACRETEKTIMKDLEMKLADVMKKSAVARKGEEKAYQYVSQLLTEKEEFNRKVADLTRTIAQGIESNNSLQARIDELSLCQLNLRQMLLGKDIEMANLKRSIDQERERNDVLQARNGELSRRLALYAEEQPQILLKPLLQQQLLLLLPPPLLLPPTQFAAATLPRERIAETAARALALLRGVELHEIGHPTNLFQLCLPDPTESTVFHSACWELGKVADSIDRQHFTEYCVNLNNMDAMTLHCELCKVTVNDFCIIEHFLSSRHIREMFCLGAAVSSAALRFWIDTLKGASAAAAVDRPMQQSESQIVEIFRIVQHHF